VQINKIKNLKKRQIELENQLLEVEKQALEMSKSSKEIFLAETELPHLRDRLNQLHIGLYG